MPLIETWLNLKQYRKFREYTQREGMTDYAFLKKLVLEAINYQTYRRPDFKFVKGAKGENPTSYFPKSNTNCRK